METHEHAKHPEGIHQALLGNAMGRIAKWALELMGEGISYAPQTTIKSQVLGDFDAGWTDVQMLPTPVNQEYWTMYFDGSLMKKGVGFGLVFVSPSGCA